MALKVGELAQRAGVSVRTLHHYDEIGLLCPSHTASGHRVYATADVTRLLQIKALRQLGFSLEEIARMLGQPGFSVREALTLRLARLRTELAAGQALVRQLEAVLQKVDADTTLPIETIFQTLEAMMKVESYFTPEQIDELEQHRAALGPDALGKAQTDFALLLDEVIREKDGGTDPASPRAQALAARWTALGTTLIGDNRQIAESARKMVYTEPSLPGVDVARVRAAGEYIHEVLGSKRGF
jgi:DNA-binding transcriptional MerR regulator